MLKSLKIEFCLTLKRDMGQVVSGGVSPITRSGLGDQETASPVKLKVSGF
jgi:hypothetical protein